METNIPLKDNIVLYILKTLALFSMILGILLMLLFPNSTTFSAVEEPGYMFIERQLYISEQKYLNDPAVLDIVETAKELSIYKQPFFVVDRIKEIHNFSNHDNGVRTPSEYLEKGGVCRDTAVFYNAIFDDLGWDTQYVFPVRGHVISIVSNKNYPCPVGYENCTIYCTIDGIEVNCLLKGDKIAR